MIIPVGFAQINFILGGNALPRTGQVVIGVANDLALGAPGLAAAVGAIFEAEILPVCSTVTSLTATRAKLGPNATGAEAFVSSGALGGRAGNPLPPNTSALVTKRSALGGRKHKGRMFLPIGTESDTPGEGSWETVSLGQLQSAVDDFLLALDGASCPMVILHSDATTPTVVTSLDVAVLMATQKRRIRKL